MAPGSIKPPDFEPECHAPASRTLDEGSTWTRSKIEAAAREILACVLWVDHDD
jgi:hypothetical protein